jgi:hypothetical protein
MIAGAGFAMMAWKLAQLRNPGSPQYHNARPAERHFGQHGVALRPELFPVSAEYYRIIDSAAASWPAFVGERAIGICPRVSPVIDRDDYMDQSREARGHHRSPAGTSTI